MHKIFKTVATECCNSCQNGNDPNEDTFDSMESLSSWVEDFVNDIAENGSDTNPNDDIQVVLTGNDGQDEVGGDISVKETGKGKSK